MQFQSPTGVAVLVATKPRRETAVLPTEDQIRRLRNEDWRRQYEDGDPHPTQPNRLVKRSAALISALYNAPIRTVYQGIADARRLRAELAFVD